MSSHIIIINSQVNIELVLAAIIIRPPRELSSNNIEFPLSPCSALPSASLFQIWHLPATIQLNQLYFLEVCTFVVNYARAHG